jgi:hypothetical protein
MYRCVYLNGKITSNNKQQISNNIINTYSIMNVELTKEEIQVLLYTIGVYIFESGNESEDMLLLRDKLSSYIE